MLTLGPLSLGIPCPMLPILALAPWVKVQPAPLEPLVIITLCFVAGIGTILMLPGRR
ncbi:MAG: hypothetical protein JO353_01260, partial [Phycisphaerae bacterium]|nr:hypothetical protein [Phycisphaerae bacterium]